MAKSMARTQGIDTDTLRAETFAGRNFRVLKKTRNLGHKLSRFADFGTNFTEKTLANRKFYNQFFNYLT